MIGINDEVLNEQIKAEVDDTWLVYIDKKMLEIKGRRRDDIVWKILIGKYGCDVMYYIEYSQLPNIKVLEDNVNKINWSDREDIKKWRDILVREVKREDIISAISTFYYERIKIIRLKDHIKIMKGISL